MKKANSLSRKVQSCIAVAVILLSLFACQKDNIMQPGTESSDVSGKIAAVNPSTSAYEMIKINHISARSLLPDYEVDLFTDLTVRFTGRRNTSTMGEKIFKTDEHTFFYLKDMFESSHLFDLIPGNTPPDNSLADIPQVFTTFNNGIHTVTLVDNNTGVPKDLYQLRVKAEEMLHIPVLLYGDFPVGPQ